MLLWRSRVVGTRPHHLRCAISSFVRAGITLPLRMVTGAFVIRLEGKNENIPLTSRSPCKASNKSPYSHRSQLSSRLLLHPAYVVIIEVKEMGFRCCQNPYLYPLLPRIIW